MTAEEVGRAVRDLDGVGLAVLRGGRICRYGSDEADRLVVVRDTGRPHRD